MNQVLKQLSWYYCTISRCDRRKYGTRCPQGRPYWGLIGLIDRPHPWLGLGNARPPSRAQALLYSRLSSVTCHSGVSARRILHAKNDEKKVIQAAAGGVRNPHDFKGRMA